MSEEYIRKVDAVSIAESYEVKRNGFHLNDYEYGRNQVADSIASDLEDMSPADVAPVVHGKWKKIGAWGRVYRCNQCGNFLDFDGVNAGRGDTNFCPNCGAKMDGEE